ncbi:hypothetical protein AX14_004741 [Amanita brunnescens Koide BX004]|nr:hypothetical protein AX14_004741 [Amanita brunnescens Koide BX004]
MDFPGDFDIYSVPPEYKKEGTDVQNLVLTSAVFCTKFSSDGRYIAAGCRRTAQMYNTKTGAMTCILIHDSPGIDGDLCIWGACFSPNGKWLITITNDM